MTLTFIDAGHILGSAQVLLEIDDQADGKKKRFLFSGDVGRGDNEVLRDPVPVEDVDFLLMESTYGGREHEAPPGVGDHFAEIIRQAHERGGKILIPAFAVERTQQVLYVLHDLFERGEDPGHARLCGQPAGGERHRDLPAPSGVLQRGGLSDFLFERQNPFGFENLTLVRSVSGSKALNDIDGVAIIISASGMCEAGRILHHLKNNIGDPKTTVLFVGYCAEQHPRPPHPRWRKGGAHPRRALQGAREHRDRGFVLRSRRSLGAAGLFRPHHRPEEARLAGPRRAGPLEAPARRAHGNPRRAGGCRGTRARGGVLE